MSKEKQTPQTADAGERLLDVQNVGVRFHTHAGVITAIRDASFHVHPHEVMAIVGESGSGKSVLTQSLLKLLPSPPSEITGGQAFFGGQDLLSMPEEQLEKVRGKQISVIFQDAMTALNPTMKIGQQITEMLREHGVAPHHERERALELLQMVKIPNPEKWLDQYIFQCSGGMRQRVMIAMALSCQPKLIIADEPTTALDVTIKAEILSLLMDLQRELDTSVVLITHDLGMVAACAHRIGVMYGGAFMETGTSHEIFYQPSHPYTLGLLEAAPRLDMAQNDSLVAIPGTPPNLHHMPAGCPFSPRCAHCMAICHTKKPPQTQLSDTHRAACWLLDPRAGELRTAFEQRKEARACQKPR